MNRHNNSPIKDSYVLYKYVDGPRAGCYHKMIDNPRVMELRYMIIIVHDDRINEYEDSYWFDHTARQLLWTETYDRRHSDGSVSRGRLTPQDRKTGE